MVFVISSSVSNALYDTIQFLVWRNESTPVFCGVSVYKSPFSRFVFGGGRLAYLFRFLCCFCFVCLHSVSDCLCLWIVHSVFSNVYHISWFLNGTVVFLLWETVFSFVLRSTYLKERQKKHCYLLWYTKGLLIKYLERFCKL